MNILHLIKVSSLALFAFVAMNGVLLAASAAPASPGSFQQQAAGSPVNGSLQSYQARDYPRDLGSAAENYIEQKNAGAPDVEPGVPRDKLHPDVDDDQDVEYMFNESEVW